MQNSDAADACATGARRTDPLLECSLDGLRRRTSAKWRFHPPDVLPLWVAEMDVPLAAPVAGALREAVALGDTGYAPGPEPYAEAFDAFARDRWGWRIPTERTRLVPDVMQGVAELLKTLTGPYDTVVLNSPVYAPFYSAVSRLGRRVLEAPLGEDHRLDLDALAAAFASATEGGRPAAYLLCSPHNPTGTVHTAGELRAVAEVAEAHGVRVVADEIHAPLVLRGSMTGGAANGGPGGPETAFVPYLSVPGASRGFSVISASKAWNLAGLKAALAVAGEAAADDLARVPEEVGNGASHLGVIAHVAALRHGRKWLDSLLTGLAANRDLLSALLERHLPEVGFRPPEGTFLAWLDCRGLGLGDDPAAAFLERGRVALVAGPVFGTGGAGHARLNFATSPGILAEAVRRMASAV